MASRNQQSGAKAPLLLPTPHLRRTNDQLRQITAKVVMDLIQSRERGRIPLQFERIVVTGDGDEEDRLHQRHDVRERKRNQPFISLLSFLPSLANCLAARPSMASRLQTWGHGHS